MTKISSPCVQVCELNARNICKGCLRSREEIAHWLTMSSEQREQIMQNLHSRKSADAFI